MKGKLEKPTGHAHGHGSFGQITSVKSVKGVNDEQHQYG